MWRGWPSGERIYVTEALSSIRPPEEQAVEAAQKSVQRRAQERLARAVPEKLAPSFAIELQSDSPAWMKAAASGSVSNRSAKQSRCSFCRAELGESPELTIPGSGKHGQRAST